MTADYLEVLRVVRSAVDAPEADLKSRIGDDFDFASDRVERRSAAVLVPLVVRDSQVNVILTRRPDAMRHHAGQIAFPGGAQEPEDSDLVATALRETFEEIGVPASTVEVFGKIERYRTVSGFEVEPVVGLVASDAELIPEATEVAEIFEVPLAFLLDGANQISREEFFRGRKRRYYEILHGQHRIWGATAGMIVQLAERVRRV